MLAATIKRVLQSKGLYYTAVTYCRLSINIFLGIKGGYAGKASHLALLKLIYLKDSRLKVKNKSGNALFKFFWPENTLFENHTNFLTLKYVGGYL